MRTYDVPGLSAADIDFVRFFVDQSVLQLCEISYVDAVRRVAEIDRQELATPSGLRMSAEVSFQWADLREQDVRASVAVYLRDAADPRSIVARDDLMIAPDGTRVTMNDREWSRWWGTRGKAHLSLILWAVWDPLGSNLPDEYEHYSAPVAKMLREGRSEAEIAERLAALRQERMEIGPSSATEGELDAAYRAADWFAWEMESWKRGAGSDG